MAPALISPARTSARPALAGAAVPAVQGSPNTAVKAIDRIPVRLQFKPGGERHMLRTRPDWLCFEILKVHLVNGVTGIGESQVYHNGAPLSDEIVGKVVGRPAVEMMWDDALGDGLQMALFDAVAKSLDVPVHNLLGRQVRERAFLGWWACDQSAADWVRECKEATAQGYTSFKSKARPWFDVDEQCRALEKILPEHFEVGFDFNSFLLDTTHAGRRLPQWERYRHLALYEAPIPQEDVEGNKLLRTRCRLPIALHFGSPPPMTALREEICDAFVIGGRVSRILRDATVAAMANKPFFLQLVGTSLTAVFGLHLAAVLSHARLPAVHCHHVYTQGLLRTDFTVTNGMAEIPTIPGLGVKLDEDAIEQHRIPKLQRTEVAPMLFAIHWPTGTTSYYARENQYAADFLHARLPVFPAGTNFEEILDDGSREWRDLQGRAAR